MKMLICAVSIATLSLAACATKNPNRTELDLDGLKSKITQTKANDFGDFMVELHRAEDQLDKAQEVYDSLNTNKASGDLKDYSKQGHAAADRALAHRNNAEDAFERLLSPLQADIEDNNTALNHLQAMHVTSAQIPQRNIYFAFGSDAFQNSELAKAKEVVEFLKQNRIFELTVVGYADTVGSKAHNRELAAKRNNRVVQVLRQLGLPAGTIIRVAVGEAAGADETRNPQNRRVEIVPAVHGKYVKPPVAAQKATVSDKDDDDEMEDDET